MSDKDLLDPKTMDGPTVNFTVADLLKSHPRIFLPYHAMIAGFSVLNPLGTCVGALLYATTGTPALATMATAGLVGGSAGMTLGLARFASVAQKGEAAEPPYNEQGRQMRVDGLSHNFKVRILEKSVWLGACCAGVLVAGMGGPKKLGLSAGPYGYLQAASLGSTVGSVSAVGCIMANRK